MGIDHVPVVVNELGSVKQILKDSLFFKIKDGRAHAGVLNCFVKFQDGTYLEFTMPVDSIKSIGSYYTNFLKHRQGATQMVISISSAEAVAKYFTNHSLPFELSENKVWKTVVPKGADLFYIDYANKDWKETKSNTTHDNGAIALNSVYVLTGQMRTAISEYEKYGMQIQSEGTFMHIPYKEFMAGKNSLRLCDVSFASDLLAKFKSPDLNGICGFEIKVASLADFKMLLPQMSTVIIESNQIIYFLEGYNLFFVFVE